MTDIKPAVIGTCKRKDTGEVCEYMLVGEKYSQVYEDFLGSCFDDFNQVGGDFLDIVLFTGQGKYRTAETGDIILKSCLGFIICYLEVFQENYDY